MSAPLTTDNPRELLRFLREAKIQIDPQYRAECERLADNRGVRLNYFARRGLTIDGLGEAIGERFAHRKLDAREVLELLEALLIDGLNRRHQPARKRVNRRELDAEERRVRANRNRKYRCDYCGQLARGTRASSLICGRCYPSRGPIYLKRVDPLPEELILAATAAESEAA